MGDDGSLVRLISDVVDAGNCSGCGACTLLHSGLGMTISDGGYGRPAIVRDGKPRDGSAADFKKVCPGRQVVAPVRSGDVAADAAFGRYVAVWRGWATDADVRSRGASGGVLTAVGSWLAREHGTEVLLVEADVRSPELTRQYVASSHEEVVRGAGSRYAPTLMSTHDRPTHSPAVVVGRPCEISARRALGTQSGSADPVFLSFFCAGVPSQTATNSLVRSMGSDPNELRMLQYRGDGWPGTFKFVDRAGREGAVGYDESWGKVLGPTVQWRCKVCVDGTGESADIAAGDYWALDNAGQPSFAESEGVSVVIARTERGAGILREVAAAGLLHLEPIEMASLYPRQPHQYNRRTLLAPRLLGTRLAGGVVPTYKGFGLWRSALRRPYRSAREAVGAWRRYRRFSRTERSLR